MTKQQVCIIGAGGHAFNNIYPSLQLLNVEICGVATRNMERSKLALQRAGSLGTPYDNYHTMLKEESCKQVLVITQAEDAVAIVADCIRAGKHVWSEKPLGMNIEEARFLADLAKEHQVLLMVGFMKRFAPVYTRLKSILDSKDLGELHSFRTFFAVDCTSWNDSTKGYLYFVAIHYLDLVRHLFGEVVELSGFSKGSGLEGLSQCISVRCENGCVGSITFENHSPWTREYESLDVTCEHGFIRTEDVTKLTLHKSHTTGTGIPWHDLTEQDEIFTPNSAPMSGISRDLYLRGFVDELSHFLSCCETNIQPSSNGQENIQTTILTQKILDTVL